MNLRVQNTQYVHPTSKEEEEEKKILRMAIKIVLGQNIIYSRSLTLCIHSK